MDLEGERASIIARRQQGDRRDDDGPRLALLDADREGLAGILAEKDAAVAAATAAAEAARRTLGTARYTFEREVDLREEAALDERLIEMDGLLLAAVTRANEVARRLGRGRPAWSPSQALWSALYPLNATRPRL
jgi:hypothetical protein